MITSAEREGLRARWDALCTRLGSTLNRSIVDELLDAYEMPTRHYHNARHLIQCFGEFDRIRSNDDRSDAIEMALWFHDVVYDSTRHDNEARSAEWAQHRLREAGVGEEFSNEVARLIVATQHATPPVDATGQAIVDVDLSILGQPPDVFDAYEAAIRREYAHVDEAAFLVGRARILTRFLDRTTIYSTPQIRERLEAPARQNLARSLSKLGVGSESK